MLKNETFCCKKIALVFITLAFTTTGPSLAGPSDFNIDGTFELTLDLPKIWFMLKRDPNGQPLKYMGSFEPASAYLDTGASGALLSREITDYLGIDIHPTAQFADVGVGGLELFDVSEPLYIAVADYNDPDPYNQNHYHMLSGPRRMQVKKTYADPLLELPLDVLGVPIAAGKTIVLNASSTNDWVFFYADIKEPNNPAIPPADFNVPLRFEKYVTPTDSNNIPPLPVLAYNPVIDNVTTEYNGESFTGTWLLDTGAMVSLISFAHAELLGLVDSDGNSLVIPDFNVTVSGIGGTIEAPGFEIDNLIIPTLNGFNLIFNNPRIAVHDIGTIDEYTGQPIILDGIFGSNFLCASATMEDPEDPTTWDFAETPFDKIIIDMEKGLLGFDVLGIYPLPTCGDANHPQPTADISGDCKVNFYDLYLLNDNWLRADCSPGNNYCDGADLSENGTVDLIDYASVADQWLDSPFITTCGDAENPWPEADFNHDCAVDLDDLRIIAEEWLNSCNWLNFNCRQTNLNADTITNFSDYAATVGQFN